MRWTVNSTVGQPCWVVVSCYLYVYKQQQSTPKSNLLLFPCAAAVLSITGQQWCHFSGATFNLLLFSVSRWEYVAWIIQLVHIFICYGQWIDRSLINHQTARLWLLWYRGIEFRVHLTTCWCVFACSFLLFKREEERQPQKDRVSEKRD